MKDYFNESDFIRFIFPIDGDCLNEYDGLQKDGVLTIKVKVFACPDADLTVNETKAHYNGECFEAEIPLYGYRSTLLAVDHKDPATCARIAVYRLPDCTGKFRLSSDDNILFLADITRNRDRYHSIFENPYLSVYKAAHDKYGAKVHLNLFYQFADHPGFTDHKEPFTLSMMTDKFKSEWEANSDWLHLSFHAKTEFPDKPYENTDRETIRKECEQVNREILRFAGEKTLAKVTTIHWGACNQIGMQSVRSAGYRGAMGYFEFTEDRRPLVAYYYPDRLIDHVGNRDFWKDNEEDVLYGRIDLVLNCCTLQNVLPRLEEIRKNPHRGGFMEFMIHEQYFYPDYVNYIKDFKEIVMTACRWAHEHGYQGRLMDEVMFEK